MFFLQKKKIVQKEAKFASEQKHAEEESKQDTKNLKKICKEWTYTKPCHGYKFLALIFKSCQSVRVCSKYFGSL